MNYFTEIKDELKKSECDFSENEELKGHTSFKIGGKTPLFIKPDSSEKLSSVLNILKSFCCDYFIIGNGSNLLVSDNGVDYPVISLGQGEFTEIKVDSDKISAGSGALLVSVCRSALANSLSGLEFAYGIPGSVGGTVFMNAGAYGGEIADCIEYAEYIDENGILKKCTADDMELSYRHSFFCSKKYIITKAVFKLNYADKSVIKSKMDDFMSRRKDKQPLEYPSAGSVFKRPEGMFAGKLIEDCGLKGYRIGGAMVSEKHAGFIVNYNSATQADVTKLIKYIRKTVSEKFGVELVPEIRFIK